MNLRTILSLTNVTERNGKEESVAVFFSAKFIAVSKVTVTNVG